jgi:hypothetical protein
MKIQIALVSLFVGIGFDLTAHADCSHHNSCFAFSDLVQRITIIGKKDNRFTYDDYKLAQNNMFKVNLTTGQIHSLTSGTGAFYCGGFGGGANLVMRDNLLLLAAHQLLKEELGGKSCIGKFSDAELAKCQFRTIDGNGKIGDHPYFIDPSSLRLGDRCSAPESFSHDWAVVELRESVVGAQHYDVLNAETLGTSDNDYNALKGMKVVVTAARNSDFKKDGALMDVPTLCDGQLDYFLTEEGLPRHFQYRQGTGCSSGKGNSGGGIVVPMGKQRPAIIGVLSGTLGGDYDFYDLSKAHFSAGPLIEGDLAKLLESCASKC